jgi:hypothetical protein
MRTIYLLRRIIHTTFESIAMLKIATQGIIAGQAFTTTVDAPIAKYYLENYLQNKKNNGAFDEKIDRLYEKYRGHPLDRELLEKVTAEFSTDFATLYLVEQLRSIADYQAIQSAYVEEVRQLQSTKSRFTQPIAPGESLVVLFAPGWFYRTDTSTGADFAKQRQALERAGVATKLIETEENGAVEVNAAIIATTIREMNRHYKTMMVVSTSKAGAEVAYAVGKLLKPEEQTSLKIWVSVGGLLRGSPVVEMLFKSYKWWLLKLKFFLKKWSVDSIKSLSASLRRQAFDQLRFPKNLLIVHYLGVPLSGQITAAAKVRYGMLRKHGPNDGLTLLIDELTPQGLVILESGLDHYYLDDEIELKSLALTKVVLRAASVGGNL